MTDTERSSVTLRIRREIGGLRGLFERVRDRWWFRVLAVLALAVRDLRVPRLAADRAQPALVDALRTYEPPLPTYVRSVDGIPIHSYARERRVQLSYDEYPPLLVKAFLAAEDKTFFEHHGVDYPGAIGAVFDYIAKSGTGVRAPRRIDDHPAGRQEPADRQRIFGDAQDQGSDPGVAHRGCAVETADPRALSQHDRARPQFGRGRCREPRLFRQGPQGSDAPADGLSGDPAQGAVEL